MIKKSIFAAALVGITATMATAQENNIPQVTETTVVGVGLTVMVLTILASDSTDSTNSTNSTD